MPPQHRRSSELREDPALVVERLYRALLAELRRRLSASPEPDIERRQMRAGELAESRACWRAAVTATEARLAGYRRLV